MRIIKREVIIVTLILLLFSVSGWAQTPTMTPTVTPTELPLDCSGATVLNCGDILPGDNTGKPSRVAMYGCLVRDASAGEDIYSVTVPVDTEATFMILGASVDLDLYLLEFCNDETCLAFGDTQITFTLAKDHTYYLLVDGYMGSEGSYNIQMTCVAAPTKLDCTGAYDVCDMVVYDDNLTAANNVDFYLRCIPWEESGGERVYYVNLTSGYIRAYLTDMTADLDLFLLSACDEKQCVQYGDFLIDTGLYPLTPGLYYLVVDGFLGDRGSYTLTVICGSPTPTPTGTWFTSTPTVKPSSTPTPTYLTHTPTNTPTNTMTSSYTFTPTNTSVSTNTVTPTFTSTPVNSYTPTPTSTTSIPMVNRNGLVFLILILLFFLPGKKGIFKQFFHNHPVI